MGKTNLLCHDLVRCASRLFHPCSDIKLYRVQLGPVICPVPPILGSRPANTVPGMRMSSLRSLVHARKGVLESTLDESIFAANLATVLQGTAPPVYGESAKFFSRTHPLSRLKALLNLCLGRFAGAQMDASPNIRTNTNLGGGKTHNLIVVDEIAQYLQKAGGVEVGNGTLADQTLTLLMALCEAAAQVPRTVLILTTTRLECIQQRYREGRCLDNPRAGNHRLASLPYPAFGRGRSAFHVVWMLSRGAGRTGSSLAQSPLTTAPILQSTLSCAHCTSLPRAVHVSGIE